MNAHVWRGIDWREVETIEGEPGTDVTVKFSDGRQPVRLDNYPGEGTYQRAKAELRYCAKPGE